MEPTEPDVSSLNQSPRDFQAISAYLRAVADYRRYLNFLRWMQDNDLEPTGFYKGGRRAARLRRASVRAVGLERGE